MRAALLLIGLVVLVLGGFVWSQLADAAPPALDPAAAGAAAEQGAAQRADGDAADESAAAPHAEQPVEREEASAAAAPTSNVRVVRFGSGEPVAGAEVWSNRTDFDWSKLEREERDRLSALARDMKLLMQAIGQRTVTDARGGCSVDPGARGSTVVVCDGELYGSGYLRADHEGVLEVAVRRDRTMRIQVLTHDGAPAVGISPVAAAVDPPKERNVHTWVLQAADARGMVTVPHAQQFAGESASMPTRIVARCEGGDSEAVSVDMCEPPELLELTLPPTGTVRLRLFDAAGKQLDASLCPDRPRVQVLDEEPSDPEAGRRGGSYVLHDLPVVDGMFEKRYVLLDKFVVARFSGFGGGARGAGPTRDRPVVTLDLREMPSDAVVVGVLRDQDGAPLPDQELSLGYKQRRGSGTRSARTDDEGRFRCCLGSHAVGEDVVLSATIQETPDAPKRYTEWQPRKVVAGVNQLGDVSPDEEGVLVAGRLVRGDGVEVERVTIKVERNENGFWQQQWQLRPKWHDDGRFTVRGTVPPEAELRIVVVEGPYLPVDPIPFEAGATDLEVVLRGAGHATATFLVDDGCPVDRLRVFLDRVGEPEPSGPQARLRRRFRGRLHQQAENGRVHQHWTGLKPGTWTLTVSLVGRQDALLRLDGIRIDTGACQDPRLEQIDLRGRVRSLTIRAQDEAGAAIADPEAFVIVRNEGGDWRGFGLASGEARVAASAAVDLLVWAPGHEAKRLDAVSTSQTVVLAPAREGKVRVELPFAIPDGYRLSLELRPALDLPKRGSLNLDTGRGMSPEHFFVDRAVVADGVCTVPVHVPGSYGIRAMLYSPQDRSWYVGGTEPGTVTLGGGGAPPTARIGEQALNRAIERSKGGKR